MPASYPDVSPSMKISTQRTAGRGMWARQRFASHFSPSQSPLRFITSHSRVLRVPLAFSFRVCLCAKKEEPEEETVPGAICWKIVYRSVSPKLS